jgi:CHASE2 domain-containing sensor protein
VGARTGIPIFPAEPDGAVREYQRLFQAESERANSLSWAVVKVATADPPRGGNRLVFNFHGDRTKFPVIQAGEFLGESFHPDADTWKPLRNKVILVGGRYSAARDEYVTAVGHMAGVELIAHAVYSDLIDQGICEFSEYAALPIDFAIGFLIVAGFYYLPSLRLAFWTTLIGTILIAFFGSLLTFRSGTYWINFVPMVAGILLHQLLDHAERYRHMQRELEKASRELEARKVGPGATG